MNTKNVFRLLLIVALATVPMSGMAQETEQTTATTQGEPGPWIFTFMGIPYAVPGSESAEGSVESNIEIGVRSRKILLRDHGRDVRVDPSHGNPP